MSASDVARRTVQEHRGLLRRAEPILSTEDEPMDGDREAFIAFDTAKLKNAIAIAEGGRTGEEVLGRDCQYTGGGQKSGRQARTSTTHCNFVM